MNSTGWRLTISFIFLIICQVTAMPPEGKTDCRPAFLFKFHGNEGVDSINICTDRLTHSTLYEANLNMSVCDDKLCAILQLKMCWDLAGNYVRFDTLPGKPLTKFDHKRFSTTDYQKLDQILADRNSMLRVLEKEDLIDKSIQVKATTIDAITGATPETIKNAVVEGAVYSSFTLWHYVNDTIKDRIRDHTKSLWSDDIVSQLLNSHNFETQFFALKQFSAQDYITHFELLCSVIQNSSPLIKAHIISKLPLPFEVKDNNRKLASIFSGLDGYSKSVMLNRITDDSKLTTVFLPLLLKMKVLDGRQKEQLISAGEKFGIHGYKNK